MRLIIKQDERTKKEKVLGLISFNIIVVFICIFIVTTENEPTVFLASISLCLLLSLIDISSLLTGFVDYYIDETGIVKMGCCGYVPLTKYKWDDVAFVGVVNLRFVHRLQLSGKSIVCSTFIPQKKYSNSVEYDIGEQGCIKIKYDASVYQQLLKIRELGLQEINISHQHPSKTLTEIFKISPAIQWKPIIDICAVVLSVVFLLLLLV